MAEVDANRRVLNALDPNRQLARGWSITTTSDGEVLRSVAQATPGSTIVTRVSDGNIESTVSAHGNTER